MALSGYRRLAALLLEPHRRRARAQRDDDLASEIQQVWQANMQVHGADKVWRQLVREGTAAARCTVERLRRRLWLRGVMRGKVVKTTISDATMPAGSGQPAVLRAAPESTVGQRFHVRVTCHVAGLANVAFVNRCVRPSPCGLAGQQLDAHGLRGCRSADAGAVVLASAMYCAAREV